jgi:hypothetical protein
VSTGRVHREDVGAAVAALGLGALAGAAGAALVVGFTHGATCLGPLLGLLAPLTACLVAVTAIAALAISVATAPSVENIARRQPPIRSFGAASWVIKVAGLLVVMSSIPAALAHAERSAGQSADAGRWEHLSDLVSVRLGGAGDETDQRYDSNIDALLNAGDRAGLVALSYPITNQLADESGFAGPYDQVALADTRYLELWRAAGAGGHGPTLKPLDWTALPADLAADLRGALAIWIRQGVDPAAVKVDLYEAAGGDMLPVIGTAGDGAAATGERQLVAVVAEPVSVFDVSGFLAPALSSGNLVFTDGGELSALVDEHALSGYVLAIDRVADLSLDWAQTWSSEAKTRFAGVSAVALALLMALVVSAQGFAALRARDVFAERTAGRSYGLIVRRRLIGEGTVFAVCGAVAVAASATIDPTARAVRHAAWTALGFALYLAVAFGFYRASAVQAFRRAVRRQS